MRGSQREQQRGREAECKRGHHTADPLPGAGKSSGKPVPIRVAAVQLHPVAESAVSPIRQVTVLAAHQPDNPVIMANGADPVPARYSCTISSGASRASTV